MSNSHAVLLIKQQRQSQSIQDVIPTFYNTCQICLDQFNPKEYIPRCSCKFCGSCIFEYLAENIKSLDFKLDKLIKCPNTSCGQSFSVAEWSGRDSNDIQIHDDSVCILPKIKEIDDLLFLKYLQQQPDIRCCPNSQCKYFGFLPSSTTKYVCDSPFECDQCQKSWVGQPQCTTQSSYSSILYRFREFLSECQKIFYSKKCPQCKIYINKNRGCKHMECSRCKFNFCWTCSLQYENHSQKKCTFFLCLKWSPFILITMVILIINGFHIKLWKCLIRFTSLTIKFCAQNILIFCIYQCLTFYIESARLQKQLDIQGFNLNKTKKQKQNMNLAIIMGFVSILYLTILISVFHFQFIDITAFSLIEAATSLLIYYAYIFLNFFYQNWIKYVY